MGTLGQNPVLCLEKLQKNIERADDETNTDTLFSIYLFGELTECVQHETKRFELTYDTYNQFLTRYGGRTRLFGSVNVAICDARDVFTKYGEHAWLYYVITDGQENAGGRYSLYQQSITQRDTIVYLVPDASSKALLVQQGVPSDCIDVWDLTAKGLEEATERFTESYKQYNVLRAQGVTSTTSYFKLNAPVSKKEISKVAEKLPKTKYRIVSNNLTNAQMIRPLVEYTTGSYSLGNSYYELVKKETIQAQKELILINKKDGTAYRGSEVRRMLGLPDYEVKIQPGDFGDWYIYVQSTSVNRNIIPKQTVLVLK